MNWSEARGWLQLLFTVITALWAYVATRHRATKDQLAHLQRELMATQQRLALAEQSLQYMPRQTEVAQLTTDLRVMTERLSSTQEQFNLMRQMFQGQIDRMDEFLRKKS